MNLFKKAVRRGLRPEEEIDFGKLSEAEKQSVLGCFGKKSKEAIPKWLGTESEYILGGRERHVNSWIVMGRDRIANRMSGFGGKCHTQAWSIDIVVGLMGHNVVGNDRKYINPNARDDAARIYLSQKTDIDEHFSIENETTKEDWGGASAASVFKGQPDSKNKSAIAIKADAVRIIGRESIRIVTIGDGTNSAGGDIASRMGIDLIAGNDYRDLQPMVKGSSLVNALTRLSEILQETNSVNFNTIMAQTELNLALMAHAHLHWDAPTILDPLVMAAAIKTCTMHVTIVLLNTLIMNIEVELWKINYLQPFGGKYILSRWNKVN